MQYVTIYCNIVTHYNALQYRNSNKNSRVDFLEHLIAGFFSEMCTEEDLELPQGGLRGTSTPSFARRGWIRHCRGCGGTVTGRRSCVFWEVRWFEEEIPHRILDGLEKPSQGWFWRRAVLSCSRKPHSTWKPEEYPSCSCPHENRIPRADFVIWRRKNPRRHAYGSYGSGRRRVMTINDPNYRAAVEIMNKQVGGNSRRFQVLLTERWWTNPKDGWRVRQKVWRTGSRPLDPVSPCVGDGSWLYNLLQTLRNVVKRNSQDKCFLFRKCSPLGVSRPAVYCAYTGMTTFCSSWMIHSMPSEKNFTERSNGRNQLTKTCCHTDFCGLCLGNMLRSLRWTDEDFRWNTAHWPAWPKLLIKCFFCNTCHRIFGHEHICFIVFRGEAPR
jgi:hypothetical protein